MRRRGIAVAICASGNYLAGAILPPLVQQVVETAGWRTACLWLGFLCAVAMPLLEMARARPPRWPGCAAASRRRRRRAPSASR